MKKGIWLGGFPTTMPLVERFALAKHAGFDGVEIEGTPDLFDDEARLAEAVALAGHTLPVHAVMCGATRRLGSHDATERSEALTYTRRAVATTRRLGADTMLVIPAVVNERVSYSMAWQLGQEGLRGLIGAAEEHGVTLAVENVWNKFLLSPLEMARFIDEAAHPLVRAYFDTANVLVFGYPEQWIDVIGSRIARVHVKDFNTKVGNINGFVGLGEGDTRWPEVMAALHRAGYDGYITAEVPLHRHLPALSAREIAHAIDALINLR